MSWLKQNLSNSFKPLLLKPVSDLSCMSDGNIFELVSILMCLVATAFWYYEYTLEAEIVVRHGVHPLLRMPLRLDRKTSLRGEGATHDIIPLCFMDDEMQVHAGLVWVLALYSYPHPIYSCWM